MATRNQKTGVTVKAIDFDLVNGITTLMVGFKTIELNLTEYRELKQHLDRWTSGFKSISECSWYYSWKNVVKHISYGGVGEALRIEELLGIKINH